MINKLYSILVSGCNPIPENFNMYRKYTDIVLSIQGVPTYKDPFRRSLWANSLISIARTSDLYSIISELDPINSYINPPTMIPYNYISNNAVVTKWSDSSPILNIDGDVHDGIVTYSYNGSWPIMAELGVDCTISALGYDISILNTDNNLSLEISNPAVGIELPSTDVINNNARYISDVISTVDINDNWDRVALFCIYVLRRYDEERN